MWCIIHHYFSNDTLWGSWFRLTILFKGSDITAAPLPPRRAAPLASSMTDGGQPPPTALNPNLAAARRKPPPTEWRCPHHCLAPPARPPHFATAVASPPLPSRHPWSDLTLREDRLDSNTPQEGRRREGHCRPGRARSHANTIAWHQYSPRLKTHTTCGD
jgi:hypothetical protein